MNACFALRQSCAHIEAQPSHSYPRSHFISELTSTLDRFYLTVMPMGDLMTQEPYLSLVLCYPLSLMQSRVLLMKLKEFVYEGEGG